MRIGANRRKTRSGVRTALIVGGAMLLIAVLLVALVAPAAADRSYKPTLTGTVTGEGGAALPGAHVQVLSGGMVVAKAVTNGDGVYRARVAAGTYDVIFDCKTYATLTESAVTVTEPSTALDASLIRLPMLTGTVTDGTSPLRGVNVKVMSGSEVIGKGSTDRNGVYKVYVPEGTYDVTFSKYTYNPVTSSGVPVIGPSTTLDASLAQLPVLTGTVTGAGGAPVDDADVKVMSGTVVVGHGETDESGVYRVYVPEGTYDVQIRAKTYEPFSGTAIVLTAPSATFDAALTQLPVLTGTVTGDGGLPLDHVRVKVLSGTGAVACGTTDEAGVYTVFIADGIYDVTFCAKGYQPLTDTAVGTVGPSTTLDAALILAAALAPPPVLSTLR
jgi:hypothetical protein